MLKRILIMLSWLRGLTTGSKQSAQISAVDKPKKATKTTSRDDNAPKDIYPMW